MEPDLDRSPSGEVERCGPNHPWHKRLEHVVILLNYHVCSYRDIVKIQTLIRSINTWKYVFGVIVFDDDLPDAQRNSTGRAASLRSHKPLPQRNLPEDCNKAGRYFLDHRQTQRSHRAERSDKPATADREQRMWSVILSLPGRSRRRRIPRVARDFVCRQVLCEKKPCMVTQRALS